MGLEAVGAVNGAIQPRLKGNLSLLAAVCTDYGEHLALSTEATRTGPLLPCRSALRAAAGLVGKASASVKILLSRGEDKARRWQRDPGDDGRSASLPTGAAMAEGPVGRLAGTAVANCAAETSAFCDHRDAAG